MDIKTTSTQQLITLAKERAAGDTEHTYTKVPDFEPHTWVWLAMRDAYNAGVSNTHLTSREAKGDAVDWTDNDVETLRNLRDAVGKYANLTKLWVPIIEKMLARARHVENPTFMPGTNYGDTQPAAQEAAQPMGGVTDALARFDIDTDLELMVRSHKGRWVEYDDHVATLNAALTAQPRASANVVTFELVELVSKTLTRLGISLPESGEHRSAIFPELVRDLCAEASALIAQPHAEAKSPEIPDGWKLVPVEPTEAMRSAGYLHGRDPVSSYKAMLSAASNPEVQ